MKDLLSVITQSVGDRIAEYAVPEYNELVSEAVNMDATIDTALRTITVAELMGILKAQSKPLYELVREAIGKAIVNKNVQKKVEQVADKAEKTPRQKPAVKVTHWTSSGCGGGGSYSGCGPSHSSRNYSGGCGGGYTRSGC